MSDETSPAAVLADYCDLRFVKSRKIAVIMLEIPIEAASAFVAQFGTPAPDRGVPVALARVVNGTKSQAIVDLPKPSSEPKERRRFDDLSPTQQAGIRCAEQSFRQFCSDRDARKNGDSVLVVLYNESEVREHVCDHCGVTSRSELNTNPDAAAKWRQLNTDYEFWLKHPEIR